jgi:hypothetical protein
MLHLAGGFELSLLRRKPVGSGMARGWLLRTVRKAITMRDTPKTACGPGALGARQPSGISQQPWVKRWLRGARQPPVSRNLWARRMAGGKNP